MFDQIHIFPIGPVAKLANEFPQIHVVNLDVLFQVLFVLDGLAAVLTAVYLVGAMSAQVQLQFRREMKPHVANVALVRLFGFVAQHVTVERGPTGQLLAAQVTLDAVVLLEMSVSDVLL
jgi:hypothetical protein